jgi:hypothetical protein
VISVLFRIIAQSKTDCAAFANGDVSCDLAPYAALHRQGATQLGRPIRRVDPGKISRTKTNALSARNMIAMCIRAARSRRNLLQESRQNV